MGKFGRAANWLGGFFSFVVLAGFFALAIAPRYFNTGPLFQTTPAEAAVAAPTAAPVAAAPAPVATQTASQAAAAATAAPPTSATALSDGVDGAQLTVASYANSMTINRSGPPLQCAIYARQRTGVSLAGAAREWWVQAEGRYQRTHTPQVGAVMAMLGTSSGHVAVVSRVISRREILIDHANWMNTGEIILGAPAVDVSPNNDWTSVRVWHPQTNTLGLRPYPVQGFILPATAAQGAVATPVSAKRT